MSRAHAIVADAVAAVIAAAATTVAKEHGRVLVTEDAAAIGREAVRQLRVDGWQFTPDPIHNPDRNRRHQPAQPGP